MISTFGKVELNIERINVMARHRTNQMSRHLSYVGQYIILGINCCKNPGLTGLTCI